MIESNLNPQPKQERINPEQLTAENKETLTESVKRQVAEALEKIRKRVKAYMERDKINKNFETNNYKEIFIMIEDYPENIQKIILQKIKEEFETIFMKNIKEKNYNQIFELIDNFPPEIGLEIINKYFDRLIPIPSQVKKINEIKYDEETNQSYLNCINGIDINRDIRSENKPYAKHQCEVKKLQREENKKVLLEEERKFILKIISIYNQLTPENKERLGNYQDVISDIYLTNREIFNPIFKDKEGKEKLKKGVNEKLKKIIEKENIPLIIQNLDLIYNFEENSLLRSNIENILLKVDEAVIQEELKTCPEHIRKLYEERFEKRYIKREYLEKAITGARGKLESAQTEEERKKYEQVIEGLEYLRDWEKNTREHCKRMEEKYGVMEESLVEHMLEKMHETMFKGYLLEKLRKFADKEGLDLIEYIALLQKKYCEVFQNEMELYSWKPRGSVWVIFGENDHKRKRFWSSREEGDVRGGGLRIGIQREINDRVSLGEIYGGKLLGSNYATHGVLQTQELVNIHEFTNINDTHYGGIMHHLIRDKVAERSTFSLYDTDPNISLVAIPHIYGFISDFLRNGSSGKYLRDGELIMDRETFVRNIPKMGIDAYWEVQFHGETGYADQISEIIYHPQTYSNEQVMEFRRIVEEYNALHPENPVTLITFEEYHRREKEKLQK